MGIDTIASKIRSLLCLSQYHTDSFHTDGFVFSLPQALSLLPSSLAADPVSSYSE